MGQERKWGDTTRKLLLAQGKVLHLSRGAEMAHPESQERLPSIPTLEPGLGLLDGYGHRPHTEVQERPSQGWFSHIKGDSLLMDAMGLKTTHGNYM